MQKPQSIDTAIRAEKVQIELIRRKAPAEKMATISDMTMTAIRLSKRAIARANLEFDVN